MKKEKTDKASSSVLGAVLIFIVIVILIALLGSFFLNIGRDTGQNAQAGVNIEEKTVSGNSTVDITLISLENADFIHIRISTDSSDGGVCKKVWSSQSDVGKIVTIGDNSVPPSNTDCEVNGLEKGDVISIIGELESENTTINTYTVK